MWRHGPYQLVSVVVWCGSGVIRTDHLHRDTDTIDRPGGGRRQSTFNHFGSASSSDQFQFRDDNTTKDRPREIVSCSIAILLWESHRHRDFPFWSSSSSSSSCY